MKRAALYAIVHSEQGVNRCKIAGKVAKALSVSSLAKNTPSSISGRGDHISMFVSISVLRVNRYVYVDGNIIESDYSLYEDALGYIFEHAEVNYAMGVYYDLSEEIYGSKSILEKVMPLLIERYRGLSFIQQFEYSRKMLVHLFYGWSKLNKESWEVYSKSLVQNKEVSCVKILEKLVEDERDLQGIEMLLNYFGHCVDVFNERLNEEGNIDQNKILKSYFANHKKLLNESN